MSRKLLFLIKILAFILLLTSHSLSIDLTIIPLKKPALDNVTNKKIILKPVSKPKKDKTEKNSKKIEIVKKKKNIEKFLTPRSKPLIVKKQLIKIKNSSKHFEVCFY